LKSRAYCKNEIQIQTIANIKYLNPEYWNIRKSSADIANTKDCAMWNFKNAEPLKTRL